MTALGYLLAVLVAGGAVLGQAPAIDDQTAIRIEALSRLKGTDLESNAALKGAVLKVLDKTRGTPHFVDLVRDFELKGHGPDLLEYALKYPNESAGVEAFRLAAGELGVAGIEPLRHGATATAAIQLIGNSNDPKLQPLLHAALLDPKSGPDLRKEAMKALARSRDGAGYLLELAGKGDLPPEVKLAASSALNLAPWPEIRKAAGELLPLPQSQNAGALPPISELVKRPGDARHGQEIFRSATATCSSCHQVNGQGMDFGPGLSEIGTKLGKEALYEAILDPSAGISFGYEAWSVELKDGEEAFGLLAGETADEIAIKTQNGVTTEYPKDRVAKRQKMASSIMPTGLQLTMATQDLVDLIEYLSSLKKPDAVK